ncbi:MAG: ABC transporter substrate-binding protein [Deltaproteobacteria bacterium]|nr:ABC transporter substrate-binding protein [Deltaproteobacteria bacterium]
MGRIAAAALVGLLAAVPAAMTGRGGAREQEAAHCARRIVSLAPHGTQALFAIGAGGDVVGVDDFSREPPEARALPRLGAYIDPDLEGIIGLRPDLILLTPGRRDLAGQLGGLGLRVRIVPDTRMNDVFETIELLGGETCRDAPAADVVRRLREGVAAAGRAAAGGARVRAVLIVDRPAGELRQFYVAGSGNFLDDVLRAAGAENIFGGAMNSFPQVSLEPIATADPDLVIELAPGADVATAAERVALWSRVAPQLRAVRTGNVAVLTEPWIPVPGTMVDRAVGLVAEAVARARGGVREEREEREGR